MFDKENRAFIAKSADLDICFVPKMANRHGLITGATGTGKTVTLQMLAETFSKMGVPVFVTDIKGDLSGIAAKGGNKDSIVERVNAYGLADIGFTFQGFPAQFWDVFGESGIPVRATVSDMGPLLLSRLLSLNETQNAVLTIVFKIAADENIALVDFKDLRKILEYVADNKDKYTPVYGNISIASVGAIQRGLLAFEHEGAENFFGEPDLNIDDFLQTEGEKGVINILAADKLMNSPRVYTTFLLWLMTRLFDELPEVGDMDKPKLVFFFDEAHLLFSNIPEILLERIEQVIRLIRSKGVGIYFISQIPSDIPDSVLGQLGNRIQHALRAYTPKDQKAIRAAAQAFRANPSFDTETVLTQLGIGEALVSLLDEKGAPMPVERAFILPPEGQIGPLDEKVRQDSMQNSMLYRWYAEKKERESAFEVLTAREQEDARIKEEAARAEAEEKRKKEEEKIRAAEIKAQEKEAAKNRRFWGNIAKSILVPLARQALGSFLRRK